MALKVLISPPATGKTNYCLTQMQRRLQSRPLAPVWVVLPDRLQVEAFTHRLAASGGVIGGRVGTFGDLYTEILERAGSPTPLATEPFLHRILWSAIDELRDSGRLSHYEPIASTPGFQISIRKRIAELKRARVFPDVFLELAHSRSDPSLIELALIYDLYQNRLQEIDWADPEGISWLAVIALEERPALVADWETILIDGFDSFIATQREAIRLLAQQVPETLVTLPGTPEITRKAHRRAARALAQLSTLEPEHICSLSTPPQLPEPLAHLEKSLFTLITIPKDLGNRVQMVEARSPADEVREVLRWLKARYLRDSVPVNQSAVVVPDLKLYRPYLQAIADEFSLPLRFSQGIYLTQEPVITALFDLLALAIKDYPRRLTLDAVRSPFFDLGSFGFQPAYAEPLENVSRFGQVVSGLEKWLATLQHLATDEALAFDALMRDEQTLPHLPKGETALSLVNALKALANRLSPPPPQDLSEWIYWLEDLLDDLSFFPDDHESDDIAIYNIFRDVLRALTLSEVTFRGHVIDYGQFVSELHSTLDNTQSDQTTSGHHGVKVLSIIETRGLRFQAVAILGLAEGLIPEIERPDPFLNEAVRQELGLEARIGREQGGLFYQALTRSDGHLLMTRPYLAEGGEVWEPSPYWYAVTSMMDGDPQHIRPEDPRPLCEAGSEEETLFWAVRRAEVDPSRKKGLPSVYAPLADRWEHLRLAKEVVHARSVRDPNNAYEGWLSDLKTDLQRQFGASYVWSPSRLEAYGECPYRFFIEQVLELSPKIDPVPGFDAAQLGSMLHTILEGVYQTAKNPLEAESVLKALPKIANEVFQRAPRDYGFQPNILWEVQQAQLITMLERNIKAIAAQSEGWLPFAFEEVFGMRGRSALEIDDGDAQITIRGVIDRLDRNTSGGIRVVDYKTGGSHLSSRDLSEGRRLQLPLYALAVKEALKLGYPEEGIYWKLFDAEPGPLKLKRFKGPSHHGLDGALELAKEHVRRYVKGISGGNFSPNPPRDGCPSYCAAAVWCWQFTSRNYRSI